MSLSILKKVLEKDGLNLKSVLEFGIDEHLNSKATVVLPEALE